MIDYDDYKNKLWEYVNSHRIGFCFIGKLPDKGPRKYSGNKITIVGNGLPDIKFIIDNLIEHIDKIEDIEYKIATKYLIDKTSKRNSQQQYKLLTIYLGNEFKTIEYLINDINYYLKEYGDKSSIKLNGSSHLNGPIWIVNDLDKYGEYISALDRKPQSVEISDNKIIFKEI